MKFKKSELYEIIDSNGNLIGKNAVPTNGSDLETQANNTTDYNRGVGTQPLRYDFMGRFGIMMPFMEGKEDQSDDEMVVELAKLMYEKYLETLEYYYRNPNKLKSDFRIQSENDFESQSDDKKNIDFSWARKIIAVIEPYLNGNESKTIDEAAVVEDKVISKRSESEISKKSKVIDIREKKLEKIAGLINNKLDKKDIDKLINLLERG